MSPLFDKAVHELAGIGLVTSTTVLVNEKIDPKPRIVKLNNLPESCFAKEKESYINKMLHTLLKLFKKTMP